jgi:hypothetical protein
VPKTGSIVADVEEDERATDPFGERPGTNRQIGVEGRDLCARLVDEKVDGRRPRCRIMSTGRAGMQIEIRARRFVDA